LHDPLGVNNTKMELKYTNLNNEVVLARFLTV